MLTAITPQAGFDYAKNRFHIDSLVENETRYVWENGQKVSKTFTDINQSMALGGLTDGVTNLELTAAYAAIANGGTYNPPVFYTKVVNHDGEVILADEISPDTCRLWDVKTGEKMDKDRFRRDLGNVEETYAEVLKRVKND